MATEFVADATDFSPARRGRDSYDDIEPWFDKLAALDAQDPHRNALREHIIELCLPLADHIARRFAGRGEAYEDLVQVARVGLLLAVDRFDLTRGNSFLSFAVPTVMGEVRRYFRDSGWAVRVPRRLKELQQRIASVTPELAQRLGRQPTATDLAAELGTDHEEITQALIAANGYTCDSIDAGTDGGDDAAAAFHQDPLATVDPNYELVEDAIAVAPLIAELPERERRVLELRFGESQTQTQIAERLGLSQMHISRILSRTLRELRERALEIQPA
ncbi:MULTISPECIES: SigB/SigF/SigG family RNA polymerase sigma factor [unclassified Nocardia]|uniref:SigB/SigF/SigG family RNA polymerase sigma factor n=1 Tax=unclassified Nocardia TaxID=2637762 RepID=UPI001CE491F5|nr:MULTISPECIES: SigB/SigF/SigG family RNA polymerase sigma factor [unclassified Nocardia]